MFDLEQGISSWRTHMLAAGIKTPVPLEELESHLREGVQELTASGMEPQEALAAAIKKFGLPIPLQAEFTKVDKKYPPPNLKSNDITHVAAIHRLLVAPLEGVEDDGTIADPAVHNDSLAKLLKQLMNKSLQSIQFVCQDLNIQPRRELTATVNSLVRFYKRDWAEALVQWVTAFIDLHVYGSDSATSY